MTAFDESDPHGGVARILRETREGYSEELRAVATALRIRYVYLLAIEEGRFDDLPGHTYAVGFVRTYAEYLGLDPEQMVRLFKEEVRGLDRKTELVFPTPVPEGKVPGGAIILVSIVLMALAYGGWLYLSNQGRTVAELIPKVPEDLQHLLSGNSATESDAPAATPPQSAPQTPLQTPPTLPRSAEAGDGEGRQAVSSIDGDGASETIAPPVDQAADDTPLPAATPGSDEAGTAVAPGGQEAAVPIGSQPAGQDGQITAGTTPETTAGTEAAPVGSLADVIARNSEAQAQVQAQAQTQTQAGGANGVAAGQAPVSLLGRSVGGATDAAGPAAPEASPQIPAAPESTQLSDLAQGREAQVYGVENGNARIVLRARYDSWVQVRDSQDTLLLTRVLRSGDTYRVPNETGLTLLTGNAGGLEILVDGRALEPLGPLGAVRRDVALDPQRLIRGTALDQ